MAYVKVTGYTDEEFNENVNRINKEIIQEFLTQRHLSAQTLKQYKSSTYIFAKWVTETKGKDVTFAQLRSRDALRFQNYLIDLGLSTSAIKLKRSVASSLYNFIELYFTDETGFENVRNIFNKAIPQVGNVKKKEKVPLTKSEVTEIKKVLEKNQDWQKLALFMVMYSTAGRRAEIVQLKSEVIEYSKYANKLGVEQDFYYSHKIRGKGKGAEGKEIRLMIGEEAMDAIRKWIIFRKENTGLSHEHIFTSYDKNKNELSQINVTTINAWVDKFGEIIGRKIHPHLIRATRSTDIVVDEGRDIRFAQKLLNHASSETTDKFYVIREEDDDMGDIF